jgi:CHASE1-domain containing sensor protein
MRWRVRLVVAAGVVLVLTLAAAGVAFDAGRKLRTAFS